MSLDTSWFSEICVEAGSAFSLKITEKLHHETTPYQTIDIYATEKYGNLMVLDGFVMLTDRDNAIYHEMMSHPALFTHPNPKRVAIIGGGDCGTLKEVLKHEQVEHAYLIEIDERVTEVSKQYFPSLTEVCSDPRAHVCHEDGVKWIKDEKNLDIILIDSTDPIGAAASLFSQDFYQDCFTALSETGIIVHQSESPLIHKDIILPMHRSMIAAGYRSTQTLHFFQSCYPSGWWTCTLAAKGDLDLTQFNRQQAENKTFETFYYNAEMHQGAMAQPEFLKRALASTSKS